MPVKRSMSQTGARTPTHDAGEGSKVIEERLRLIIDTIPTIVWRKLPDGSADFFNKHFREYTGISAKEAMGWGWMETFHPEDRRKEEWRAALAAGESFEKEVRIRRADGQYRWFLLRAVPLRDEQGHPVRWYGLSIDIEYSKRAERESRELIDAIPQQIWSGPADGTLDYCNRRWRSDTGLGLEELRGDGWQAMLHPQDRERVLKAWQESVRTGMPYEQEERHRGMDGTYRWYLARGTPQRDPLGRIVRWYGTNTDIEARKRAEEELRRLSGQLLRAQEEERRRIARDLHDSTGQHLVLLAAALTRLQSSVSPNNSKTLRLFSEAEDLAMQALREVRTLSYLLYPPMLEESGLPDAIAHYVEGYSARSDVQVDVQVSPDLGRLEREKEMALFRVVQESLTNVQRHSGSRRAHISLSRTQNRVMLEIWDEGRGSVHDTENRRTKPSPGVGILSMRERIKQVGGEFEVQSSSAGTIIRVTIRTHDQESVDTHSSR
jgi:PAS domain S-box-containing protein